MRPPEQTELAARLTRQGVPMPRAIVKVQSTRRGILFVVAGLVCIAGAFGFVIYTMTVTQGAPGFGAMIFALIVGAPGTYFLLAGGHLISGDAMHAAEESGGIITRTAAKALKIARVKDPA